MPLFAFLGYNSFLNTYCPSFISASVIKCPNKKQQRGNRVYFSSQSQVTAHNLVIANPQLKTERNEPIHAEETVSFLFCDTV